MKKTFELTPVGTTETGHNNAMRIRIFAPFQTGLTNLEGFSHLHVVWWAHLSDSAEDREYLTMGKLFRKGPDTLGVFATRSPFRPNPIMISTVNVLSIDIPHGIITISYVDAEPGTPVLDIKPYHYLERVKECRVPAWCSHWPRWQEESVRYDWMKEITMHNQSNTEGL